MIEITLSVFAWLGVVVFHAFVYFTLKTRKQLLLENGCFDEEELLSPPLLDASPIVLEDLQEIGRCSGSGLGVVVAPYHNLRLLDSGIIDNDDNNCCREVDDEDDDNSITFEQQLLEDQEQYEQQRQRFLAQQRSGLCVLGGGPDGDDEPLLDGDEPDLFFKLLSQTGSEMLSSCRTLESVAREQINVHERHPEAVW